MKVQMLVIAELKCCREDLVVQEDYIMLEQATFRLQLL
jgi:hypothetical protein